MKTRGLKNSPGYAESIFDTVREPLLVLDPKLRVISANRSFYKNFNVVPEETEGRLIYDLGNRQWDIPGLRELLDEILTGTRVFNDYKVEHEFPSIGRKIMFLNARKIYREANSEEMILLAIEDVTERKKLEKELKEREQQYKYKSYHDELTGLFNRTYFAQDLVRLGQDLKRSEPISIIMIDIDGLKLINDTFGHQDGDKLIIKTAQIISSSFRKIDMIARVGGDEFCIILPHTNHQTVLEKRSAILEAIDEHNCQYPSAKIRTSIGVATYDGKRDNDIYDTYRRADENMYEYKNDRKDRLRNDEMEMLLRSLSEGNHRHRDVPRGRQG